MATAWGVEASGFNELYRALDAWGASAQDLHAPFTAMLRDFVQPHLAKRFRDQGPGWAKLSPAYAAWKDKHFPGKPILQRTGALFTAFAGGRGWDVTITKDSVTLNMARVPYWAYHQEGTGRMPARPIVVFDDIDVRQMSWYVRTYLQSRGEALGFTVIGDRTP